MPNHLLLNKFPIEYRPPNLAFSLLIVIAVWGPVIQMLMLLLRYAGLPYFEAADVMKFSAAVIIFLGLALNLSIKKIGFNYLYPIIILPVLVGLINLEGLVEDRKYEFFIIHAAGSILIFSLVNIFSISNISITTKLIKEINRSAIIALIITFFYLAIYSSLALSDYLYFGPSTGIILVVFPWFVMQKKMKLALLCFIIVMMGGKRAVMVSLFFEIFLLSWFLGREFRHKMIASILKITPVLMMSLFLIIYFTPDYKYQVFFEFWDLASNRILGSFEDFADDPNKVSSGRFAEIEESFNIFKKDSLALFIGLGFGWSFYWVDESLHFLHFSPINFLYQYGLIIFIFFVLFFLAQIFMLYRFFRRTQSIIFGTLFVIFLGQIVEGFFSYMYVVNPLMWCIFGALIGIMKNTNSISKI
jgi:hypothetical protein